MSIVRWGSDGSDLYIYQTIGTEIVCCGCLLMAEEPFSDGIGRLSFTCDSFDKMISHVQEHINAGHTVPDYVIPELERRRDVSEEEVGKSI